MTPRSGGLARALAPAMIAIAGWGAHATVAHADDCRPVLDRNVVVEPGERRGCRLWVVGHHVAVARGGAVDGGIVVAYGSADVSGDVDGAVNVMNGDATIDGHVTGDVYASGTVTVGDTGRIGGNVTGASVRPAPGATIDGVTTILSGGWTGAPRSAGLPAAEIAALLLSALVTALLGTLFGGLAASVFPGAVAELRAQATRGAAWTFVGVVLGLAVIATTAVVIALLHSIPFVRWLAIVPVALAAGGALGIGQSFGARLLPRLGAPLQTGLGLATIAIGVSLVARSGPPALFCVGGLLLLLLSSWAIGVALVAAARHRSGHGSSAMPPMTGLVSVGGPATTDIDPKSVAKDSADAAPVANDSAEAAPVAVDSVEAVPVAERSAGIDDAAAVEPDLDGALDLRRIPGISPIYGHLLRAAGIVTLRELASQSPAAVVAALEAPGVLPVDSDTAALWIEMARRRLGR